MKLRIATFVVAGLMAGFFVGGGKGQGTATNNSKTKNGAQDSKCALVLENGKKIRWPSGKHNFSLKGYRQGPSFSYHIEEDGSVTKIKLVRSSGVKGVDRWVEQTILERKYRTRIGCGVIETEEHLLIDSSGGGGDG